MFLRPLYGLGHQRHGNVSGVGFVFDLPGEVVAQMFLAAGAAAVGIAASPADGDEAGRQDGALSLELFLAGLEEAADEGGVFGDFHKDAMGIFSVLLTE